MQATKKGLITEKNLKELFFLKKNQRQALKLSQKNTKQPFFIKPKPIFIFIYKKSTSSFKAGSSNGQKKREGLRPSLFLILYHVYFLSS